MTDARRQLVDSAAYQEFRRVHDGLSRALAAALIGVVLLFNALSIYARDFMGAPFREGGVVSNGIIAALFVLLLIIAAALYYVRRINAAHLRLRQVMDED